ncbi:phage regulatory CII family protein [Tatumella sp. TA1]|nr:phage regulatory CII family protein [Tatumella sp. TA1]
MFDFKVSIHTHFDEACREFSLKHNIEILARKGGFNPQTLRNKLNPEQEHQLTVKELLTLTDLTEDSSLFDGALAQINCLPCVPVNEVADEKFPAYVLKATAEVGMLAANTVNQGAICNTTRRNVMKSVNTGIRCLTLAAIAVQSRIHSSPTLSTTVDAISGIGASIGMN